MKRKLIIVISLMLLLSSVSFSLTNEDKAEELKNLGILKGTDQGLELDQEFTRAQGAVMLVRMLGEEEGLANNNYTHPFNDVPEWASQYVGYLYQNGLANGISSTEYGSDRKMGANDYLTFVLRALNYDDKNGDFKWENATDKANELGIIDLDTKENFDKGNFLRGDMAGVTYNGLSSNMKDSNQLLINVINERTEINTNINVTTNIDESITNTNNISNVSGSNISISTDNSDNSVNNSNNTIYDNSTTITNVVDNSTTINNDLSKIMEELQKLSEQGTNNGEILISLKLLDRDSEEPISGCQVLLNKEVAGESDAQGIVELNLFKYAQYVFEIKHENYYDISYVEAYNDSVIIEKHLISSETSNLIKLGEDDIVLVLVESKIIDGQLSDIIDYEFENDPLALGNWETVDFVEEPTEYNVDSPNFSGDLFLKGLEFKETHNESNKFMDAFFEYGNGFKPNHMWRKGVIMDYDSNDINTVSRYFIAEVSGSERLFMEWKSGDYTLRHDEPHWYVFNRVSN